MIYDVAVIGSGPAGLFAAMELARHNLNIVVLEKARRLNDSRNVSMGWFGGSARSTVKMFVEPGFGGHIEDQNIISTFIERLTEYSPSNLRVSRKKLLKKSIQKAQNLGIIIDEPQTITYTEDKMIKLGDFFYSTLREKGTVTHKLNIQKIEKIAEGFQITTEKSVFQAKKIVMGLGRAGAHWLLEKNKAFNLSAEGAHFDLGVRLEFPNYAMREFSEKTTNFRFRFDDFRTSLPIFMGTVETEELGHLKISNGRNWNTSKSCLANIGLMKTFPSETPMQDIYRLSEIINVLSDGQLLREPLSALLDDDALVRNLPEFVEVLDGVQKFIKLFPVIQRRCTVYAPEARLNALKFKLTESMESEVEGLYIVGDMSGWTNSFVQAACSGLLAANHIIGEKE